MSGGPGNDRLNGSSRNDLIFGGPGNDRIYGGPGNDRISDHQGATTVFPGSGTNRVDVADGRGDDRVVCAPGSTNHIVADPGDRIARCSRRGGQVGEAMGGFGEVDPGYYGGDYEELPGGGDFRGGGDFGDAGDF